MKQFFTSHHAANRYFRRYYPKAAIIQRAGYCGAHSQTVLQLFGPASLPLFFVETGIEFQGHKGKPCKADSYYVAIFPRNQWAEEFLAGAT
jgi:hypothetical protein